MEFACILTLFVILVSCSTAAQWRSVRNPTISSKHVFMHMDITDKGSDQNCRKRCTSEAIATCGCPNIVYLPGSCFLHMFHACVKDGLALLDEQITSLFDKSVLQGFSKYYGSLNTWRERAADVTHAWDVAFGNEDLEIAKLGRRYPVAVVSGRWGSVEAAEEFMLLRGRERVVPTLLAVLSKHMRVMGAMVHVI